MIECLSIKNAIVFSYTVNKGTLDETQWWSSQKLLEPEFMNNEEWQN